MLACLAYRAFEPEDARDITTMTPGAQGFSASKRQKLPVGPR
jgi:hypothetical protein